MGHLLAEVGGQCGLDDDDAEVEEDGARVGRIFSGLSRSLGSIFAIPDVAPLYCRSPQYPAPEKMAP
jgi:hypothetical protein